MWRGNERVVSIGDYKAEKISVPDQISFTAIMVVTVLVEETSAICIRINIQNTSLPITQCIEYDSERLYGGTLSDSHIMIMKQLHSHSWYWLGIAGDNYKQTVVNFLILQVTILQELVSSQFGKFHLEFGKYLGSPAVICRPSSCFIYYRWF